MMDFLDTLDIQYVWQTEWGFCEEYVFKYWSETAKRCYYWSTCAANNNMHVNKWQKSNVQCSKWAGCEQHVDFVSILWRLQEVKCVHVSWLWLLFLVISHMTIWQMIQYRKHIKLNCTAGVSLMLITNWTLSFIIHVSDHVYTTKISHTVWKSKDWLKIKGNETTCFLRIKQQIQNWFTS